MGEERRITGLSFEGNRLTLELKLEDENMAPEVSSHLKETDQYEAVRLSGWEESLDGQSILAQFQITLREKEETAGEGGEEIEAY